MHIQKLVLKNFRCFENLDIKLHPNLAVIVGANGSGKHPLWREQQLQSITIFVKMDGLYSRRIDKNQVRLKAFSVGSTKDVQPQYPVTVQAEAMTRVRSEKNGKEVLIN